MSIIDMLSQNIHHIASNEKELDESSQRLFFEIAYKLSFEIYVRMRIIYEGIKRLDNM